MKIDDSVSYWEIRNGTSRQSSVRVINGNVKDISTFEGKGISVRVLRNGRWGFAYSESEPVSVIAKRAVALAKSLGRGPKFEVALTGRHELRRPSRISHTEPEDLVRMFRKKHTSLKNDREIKSDYFDFQAIERGIRFENSEGSCMEQNLNYTSSGCSVTARKGSRHEEFDDKIGAQGDFETIRKGFSRMVSNSVARAKELCTASVPKGGVFTVVCDPVLVDVMIHEAFGHAAEADLVLKGESCLAGRIDESLTGPDVSIVDDPTIPGLWGSYHFDDEGVKSQCTHILKKGVLKGFMHSRETAEQMNASPTGNARAESTAAAPAVRMSNTNLQPGKATDRELFEGIKNGMFLAGSAGGQVDTAKGNFQFNARYGYRIKNGELGAPIKGVSLTGNTLEMLKNLNLVGKKSHLGLPGFCGKFGQSVPVIGFNPQVRLDNAVVGGR